MAFRGGEPVEVCQARLQHLRTVVEAAGHDWTERATQLNEALVGEYRALLSNGALDPPETTSAYFDDAGLTLDERFELCATILVAAPRRGPAIVWLAYSHAHVEPSHLQRGPVEFYDSRIWAAAIAGSWPGNPGWTMPHELGDPSAGSFLSGMPTTDFVMVRVTLENTPVSQARERGRDLARAAIELTGWESDWVLMSGEAVHGPGGWFGTFGFSDPEAFLRRRLGSPLLDPVAHQLAHVDDQLLSRLAEGNAAARELVADIRWHRAVGQLPDLEHRIPLTVALLERVLVPSSVGSDKWYGACMRYFSLLLSFDDVQSQIWDAGYYGVHALNQTAAGRAKFATFNSTLIEQRHDHSFRVRLSEVIDSAPDLRSELAVGSMEARMLEEVEQRTKNGQAARQWLALAEERFELLLNRARRQRNAAIHGTRGVLGVLATVEPFLDQLGGRLIGALHYCVENDLSLTTELQRWRLEQLKKRERLAAGSPPTTVLG